MAAAAWKPIAFTSCVVPDSLEACQYSQRVVGSRPFKATTLIIEYHTQFRAPCQLHLFDAWLVMPDQGDAAPHEPTHIG